ncbi:hypothetical protein [Streptomyces sp. B1I3]|uniref:hypothetical protein n=1 Tax=Streptomyces sp. B1I3 TaxID=3042264 RepID=UPI0027D873F0|nr:hypothetical protein [Streptomyces sp. B1I3]
MTLARSLPDTATEWWLYLGVLALYLLTRWFLAWHQARKEGVEHPVRAAFDDEEPGENAGPAAAMGAFRSYRQLLGFLAGGILIVLVATLTEGGLQLALMCALIPVVVTLLAYVDFRRARTHRRAHAHS